MSFTRSQQPVIKEYELLDSPLKQICRQEDLGIIVTRDLNCMKQVRVITSKTTSMPALILRTTSNTYNIHVQKVLYLSIVHSKLEYSNQVWTPQTVTDILSIERVQRQATKFILSFSFRTATTYRERLRNNGILQIFLLPRIFTISFSSLQ